MKVHTHRARHSIPPAKAELRLDDVLDLLQSPQGQKDVAAIKDRLRAAGVPVDGAMGPQTAGKGTPRDVFDRDVARLLSGSFLRSKEVNAAIPGAVAFALAGVADQNGMVRVQDVEKFLGPNAGAFMVRMAEMLAGGRRDVPSTRRATKYRWLPNDVRRAVAHSARKGALAARMPVLNEVGRLLGGPKALAGFKMVAVQHLFPTTQGLMNALVANGLDPKAATVYGKNYSTNEDVMQRMRADGWNVPLMSSIKIMTERADGPKEVSPLHAYLAEMFAGCDPKTETEPRFLLLDEGGKLVKTLHEDFPEFAHLCVAVEQTEQGRIVHEQMAKDGHPLQCAVINVAQSVAKKVNEAPMIGESVVHSTELAMQSVHPDLRIEPKEATVLGYGAVGKATADALRRRGYVVNVYDIDPAKMEQAAKDGVNALPREEALKRAHLLISATGRTAITPEEFDKLPDHAVLVNAASGNHELGMDTRPAGGGMLTHEDKHELVDEEGTRTSPACSAMTLGRSGSSCAAVTW
jgi:S-adenosylhomocysteine hydrolase